MARGYRQDTPETHVHTNRHECTYTPLHGIPIL